MCVYRTHIISTRTIGPAPQNHPTPTRTTTVQLILNPFFEFDKPIVSPAFDARVRTLEKRYLR